MGGGGGGQGKADCSKKPMSNRVKFVKDIFLNFIDLRIFQEILIQISAVHNFSQDPILR